MIRTIERVSRPGRRVYASVKNIPQVASGLGVSIMSTPKGVMADQGLRTRLATLDITPDFSPAPALRSRLETEIRSWTKFVDEKGIKPE